MTNKDYELWKQDVEFIGILREEKEELQARIDKAIEYIGEKPFMDIPQLLELVEILKGE